MKFFNKFGNKRNNDIDQEYFDEQKNLYEEYEEDTSYDDTAINNTDNVVDFKTAVANFTNNDSSVGQDINKQLKVIIIEPKAYDDAQQIADHIKTSKPVLLNFEKTDPDTAIRIIDFMSGVTYALSGVIKKICDNIFLCAPNNVNISFADIKTKEENTDKLSWE